MAYYRGRGRGRGYGGGGFSGYFKPEPVVLFPVSILNLLFSGHGLRALCKLHIMNEDELWVICRMLNYLM